MRSLSASVAILALWVAPTLAQQLVTAPLDSGAVVRLRLASGPAFTARLLAPFAAESASLLYSAPPHRDCGVPRAACRFHVPTADVRAIEVPTGSQVGRGALIGAAVGGILGAAFGAAVADNQVCVLSPGGGCSGPAPGATIALSTGLGAALGAGLGALFGWGSPRWGPAP